MTSPELVLAPNVPDFRIEEGDYVLKFASTLDELDAALRLRYEVFNVELGEGLAESHDTGRDHDVFDAHCHHLIVSRASTGQVFGTYRVQTVEMADAGIGFYSGAEFELDAMPEDVRSRAVESGRACVASSFRSARVLHLLWRGLAAYMTRSNKRYMFGCSSITSQDCLEGAHAFRFLQDEGHVHAGFSVDPLPEFRCPPDSFGKRSGKYKLPRLFRTYLSYGGKVCSPPALDRAFGTIDFLILMDVDSFDERTRAMFF